MNTLSKADLDRMHGAEIKDLVKRGILRVMSTATSSGPIPYTEYPEYKRHAKWKGTPISVSEAARVFGVPQPTISRWLARYPITVLQRTNREIYLDKADIAYCAEIHRKNGGAGKWLFNRDLTPHIPVTK